MDETIKIEVYDTKEFDSIMLKKALKIIRGESEVVEILYEKKNRK